MSVQRSKIIQFSERKLLISVTNVQKMNMHFSQIRVGASDLVIEKQALGGDTFRQ